MHESPLKLLQVVHTTGYGGLERQVLSLSLGLRDAGHHVCLALQPDSWLSVQASRHGFDWLPVRFRGLFDPASHLRLRRAVRRRGIDVVHGHSRRSALYSATAGRLAHCGSVATVHSLQTWKGFARNDRVIAVSNAVSGYLREQGLPDARVTRIYNGVDAVPMTEPSDRTQAREQLGIADDTIAVAMVGRMVEHKGHDLLMRALSRLGDQRQRIKLYLFGQPSGSWVQELWQMAEMLDIREQVFMPGYQQDVIPHLRGMDVFVQPSRTEALSLSLLEAMSVGLPAVAARTGGMPEVIQHGRNGLLFAADDATDLAVQLQRLLDPEERRRMAEQGRKTQAAQFATRPMVDATVALYRNVLQARA